VAALVAACANEAEGDAEHELLRHATDGSHHDVPIVPMRVSIDLYLRVPCRHCLDRLVGMVIEVA
jgi:hypothetical protein